MKKNKTYTLGIVMIGIMVVILQVPISGRFTHFEGTDDQAVGIIQQIAPDYRPWANNVFEHNAKWSEMLVFALQASMGLIVMILYVLKQRDQTIKK